MLYIRLRAYNAEKTIIRAIESVLNQTYKDFQFYVCDNASRDGTREIIKAYALKDSRIKAFYTDINFDFTNIREYQQLIFQLSREDMYTEIDADDEFEPDFLEKTVDAMNNNDADIVMAGNSFYVQKRNGEFAFSSNRVSDMIYHLNDKEIWNNLSYVYQFARTIWGKLYRGHVFNELYTSEFVKKNNIVRPERYAADTHAVLLALRNASKITIINEVLYKYYVYPQSDSYTLDKGRIESDQIIFNNALLIIKDKESVSFHTIEFLSIVYQNALIDTFKLIKNSKNSFDQKIEYLNIALMNEYTNTLLKKDQYLFFKGYELKMENLVIDIVKYICNILEDLYTQKKNALFILEILFAWLNDAENWINVKKLMIEYYIENKDIELALEKLNEVEDLITGDEDIKTYKKELMIEG